MQHNNCTLFDWNDEKVMEEDLKNLIGPGSRKWISNKDILLFFILLFFQN